MPAPSSRTSAARPVVWTAFGLYLGLLALIVLWPVPVDRPATGALQDVLDALHRHGVPAWINYGTVESAANVLLFVPFGLFAGLLLPRRRRWLVLAGAVLLSAGIELAQSSLLPERFGTVQDVLANTLGAALGAAASFLPRPVWLFGRGPANDG
ncbi:VanZ family protein [Arthrobacter sp. I2-34]|uniref:VanZ family protein n=1 Tax=Arthrobacter hankyongi TaxID=2904801 RepID=A0ABS9L1D0_9MICC|nr:VanZ family protein [Arthrobacter hankyongi]MCG2620502.1 VanZ family protein [Arthrobacter hankyongi]